MKIIVHACLGFALAAGSLTAVAASSRPQAIRPVSQCIDPDRVRGWRDLDSFRALIDVGRQHYLIETGFHCPALTRGINLRLSALAFGRICGDTGEYVVVDGGRCPIDRVKLLSPAEYDDLNGHHRPAAAPKADARKTVAATADGDGG